MREIKFRVWDVENEEMIHKCGIDPDGVAYAIPPAAIDSSEFDYYPDGVLMQYTGNQDQHGNELYEGDIAVDDDDLYVIKFEDGCFYAVLDHDTGAVITQLSELNEDIRLLGNIYENTELAV